MRVHDSQAYRKMDVTRERISRIFELREILLSVQSGFSLANSLEEGLLSSAFSGLGLGVEAGVDSRRDLQ